MYENILKTRQIRIFISSTFLDMRRERDQLVKFVFPKIRKLCAERKIGLQFVDLRWGITDEEKAEGKVINRCLDEIYRCRPFFIGILGERYGWIPEALPSHIVDREPWLKEHLQCSITELEIEYGVLRNPRISDRAFFYFRDPLYISTLPPDEQKLHLEVPSQEEVARLGQSRSKAFAESKTHKLTDLKEKIRRSHLPIHENYANPKEFGCLVYNDFEQTINKLYPEDEIINPYEQEASAQDFYMDQLTSFFQGRTEYFIYLNSFVENERPPLVLVGESGIGKSSLLATWAKRYQANHPDAVVIYYFINATNKSSDWKFMIRCIIHGLNKRLHTCTVIPESGDKIEYWLAFMNCLNEAAKKTRCVLILDGLDLLENKDQALELSWLPDKIPSNVKLIVSSLPGPSQNALNRRNWQVFGITSLHPDEIAEISKTFLNNKYGKNLPSVDYERIKGSLAASNPLYLRLLLEELAGHTDYKMVTDHLLECIEAKSIRNLCHKLLSRYERDYEFDRKGFVGDVFGLLWVSRNGLTETELLELLGSHGLPLPYALWSPLYLAADQLLANRAGIIHLSNPHLRQAVKERYLYAPETIEQHRIRLIHYFQNFEIEDRRLYELPWQLAHSANWEALVSFLSDSDSFCSLWSYDEYEVKEFWTMIEANSPFRMVTAYDPDQSNPEQAEYLEKVSKLLYDCGHYDEVLSYDRILEDYYKKNGNVDRLTQIRTHIIHVYRTKGLLDEALDMVNEQKPAISNTDNAFNKAILLATEASLKRRKGRLDEAMILAEKSERLCREFGFPDGLINCLNEKGIIATCQGQLPLAVYLFKEIENISRKLGNENALEMALGNLAMLEILQNDLTMASLHLTEQQQLNNKLGNSQGLARCLLYKAQILMRENNLSEAVPFIEKSLSIFLDLGDMENYAKTLYTKGNIAFQLGERGRAQFVIEQALQLMRQNGNWLDLIPSLENYAKILYLWGEDNKAIHIVQEREQILSQVQYDD